MGTKDNIRSHNRSIAGKIIITCLLACVAVFLSLYISRVTFRKILSTVDQLARPDTKAQLVNELFREVVILDHLQRRQALKTERTAYNPFLRESEQLLHMLDSLKGMSQDNIRQVARIDSMKDILRARDLLFINYINLRSNQTLNDTLSVQVNNLGDLIEKARMGIDSGKVTTTRVTRTITDTLNDEEEDRPLLNRIFSKRKHRGATVQHHVEEELNVRTDTVNVGNKADSLAMLGKAMSTVEEHRKSRRKIMIGKQEEINQTGDVLVAKLMSLLDDIQSDELAHDTKENNNANRLVNESVKNISAVLFIFVTGIAVLVLLIFSDIARASRYRRQLIIAKEEAEEAGMVKQRFLANMSHELRTPLQTIIGISEQAIHMQQPRKQDLENLHHSSLHLLQIVNEVLDYSRIISGKYVLDIKPFNMHKVLQEVAEMIQVQLALKKLALRYDVAVDEHSFYSGDAFRLKQVLLNLLGNAVKFTDKGTVTFTVREQKEEGRSVFTFVIADTGIGMSAADLAVVFNEFEQGTNAHKKHGTGLGLSIVNAIVGIQQGTIKAESEEGQGTTFIMTLPYATASPVAAVAASQASLRGHEGHVWFVDDDLFILQLCDSILTRHHIPHTCFSSAQQALATEFPENISIVFLDIRMAEMDGMTLCRLLKERAVDRPPQFIALTAQAFPDEQKAILESGFDGLVVKPFLEQDLVDAIAGHSAPPQDRSEIDLTTVRRMAGDDKEMLDIVLDSFIAETDSDLQAAKLSHAAGNALELAGALHKLAGRCGQIGARSLALDLRTIEIALHEGKPIVEAMPDIDPIASAIATVMNAVRSARG